MSADSATMYDSETESGHRESALTLPFMLALGWLTFELTHLPGLAAMTMCMKFGWENYRTAFWLRRNDANIKRGQACFWLYLSAGLCRTAVMAILMMILITFLVVMLHAAPQPNAAPAPAPNGAAQPNQNQEDTSQLIVGALITAMIAFMLSSVTTFRAIAFGMQHRVKFWLSSGVHRARRADIWPPHVGKTNNATSLLLSVLLLTFLVVAPFALLFLFGMIEGMAGRRLTDALKAMGFVMTYIFVAPMFILIVRDMVVARIVAPNPAACWGYEPRTPREPVLSKQDLEPY